MQRKLLLRPREKSEQYGFRTLTYEDLIVLIVRRGSTKSSVYKVAKIVAKALEKWHFGEINENQLVADISNISGLGPVALKSIRAAIEIASRTKIQSEQTFLSPDKMLPLLKDLAVSRVENVVALYFTAAQRFIARNLISKGSETNSLFIPKDIVGNALRLGAENIVVAHNHPSGRLVPSDDDIIATHKLVQIAKIPEIKVIDHLIVSKNSWYSFAQNGLLPN